MWKVDSWWSGLSHTTGDGADDAAVEVDNGEDCITL